MQGNEAVLEFLNDVLTAELTAINQYFIDSKMMANWGYQRLADKVRAVVANGGPVPAPSQATRFRITVIDYGPGSKRTVKPGRSARMLSTRRTFDRLSSM